MNIIKKYIIPAFLVIVLLGLGIFILDKKTDVVDNVVYKAKLLVEPKPDQENIHYYFQQDETVELGSVDLFLDSKESKKFYSFILYRAGEPTLVLIPEDFNLEDLNKKTFININKGSLVNDTGLTPYALNTLEAFTGDKELSVSPISLNEANIVEAGVGKTIPYKYLKVKDYENEDIVHFYMDDFNHFKIDLSSLKGLDKEVTLETLFNY